MGRVSTTQTARADGVRNAATARPVRGAGLSDLIRSAEAILAKDFPGRRRCKAAAKSAALRKHAA